MQACHTCRIALAYAWSRFLADAQRRYSVRYGMWTATSIHTLRSMLPVGLRVLNVHEFNIPRFLGGPSDFPIYRTDSPFSVTSMCVRASMRVSMCA